MADASTTGPLWLDLDTFWDVAFEFEDWDYTFTGVHAQPFIKGAQPGYPAALLDAGDRLNQGRPAADKLSICRAKGWLDSDAFAGKPESGGRRYTNCCIFVESAILGTAYRMPWKEQLAWPGPSHDSAMFNGPAPPIGYAKAGLAELLDPIPAELEPNTIYVVQRFIPKRMGHTFFIIDYDPATKKFLTLEANHGASFAKKTDSTWWGGVGYSGLGRVLKRPPPRAEWLKGSPPTWPGEGIYSIARLHVRESGYAPSVCLPFDPPADPGPPARHFDLAETKVKGGFYPVGTQRNLHGGVHLPLPGDAPAPVHALADGDVVAARLGSAGKGHQGALDAAGNHAAFVLVRHRVEVDPPSGSGAKEALTLYSLYMHLVPPGARSDLWKDVPWLQRLQRQANGALVEVDPASATFRRRSWPTEGRAGTVELLRGAVAVAAAGDDGKPVTFGGSPPADRVSAAWRKAEADVAQAVKVLTAGDGEVATFAAPFLPVRKGELLGFVAPVPLESRAEPAEHGFLHWELLAPVGTDGKSALERLTALGEAHLGLPAGHFVGVKETSANNQLDGDEVGTLAAALPAPRPDGDWPARLAPLMNEGSAPHPFALPVEGERRATLDYPVRLEVETLAHLGQPTLAARTLEVTLETDAGPVTASVEVGGATRSVVVHLPAAARRVTAVKAAGVVFDPGKRGKAGEEALHALELEHFRRLTSTRWRNVRLRHLNEWSVAGLTRSLEPRRAELGKDGLRALVEAVAWWGHAETPIVGPEGQEQRLFGGELPAQAELLDALHPVTAAWLLDLLVGRGKARFLAPGGAGHEARVALLGWLPADGQPRAVGDPVWAVRIAAGDVTGGLVTFEATQGARRVVLGADAWAAGTAAVEVGAPLWGRWTLAGAGEPLGSTTLDVAAPGEVAEATYAPPSRQLPAPTWTLEFERDRPAALTGWGLVRTRAPGAAAWGEPEPEGIPLRLVPPPAGAGADPVEEGGFYVSGKAGSPVSANFTYGELCKAAPGSPKSARVSKRLVLVLQALRGRTTSLTPSGLTADGLSLKVTGPSQAKLVAAADAARAADAALFDGVTTAPDGTGLRLTVPPPPPPSGGAGGPLRGELAPAQALRALLTRKGLAAGESLEVSFGCLFLNGAAPTPGAPVDDGWRAAADGLSPADRLEVWSSDAAQTLVQAGLGPITARFEGASLVLRADLVGRDAAFWKGAEPRFTVGEALLGRVDGAALVASLPVGAGEHAGKVLTVGARATKEALPDGSPVSVTPAAPVQVDARPDLLGIDVTDGPAGLLTVVARLQAWPVDKDAELRLLDADGAPLALAKGGLAYARPSKAGFGLPTAEGELRATLKVAAVRKALAGRPDALGFQVAVGRPKGWPGVFGKETPSPSGAQGHRLEDPAPAGAAP